MPLVPLSERTGVVVIAVLAGLLLASSNIGQGAGLPLFGVYLYWLVRIGIEAGLFVLIRDALQSYWRGSRLALTIAVATFVSLIPFVLAITAIDIALGYPELGLDGPKSPSDSRVAELGLEFVYLLDNHLFLCLLLSVPQMLVGNPATAEPKRPTLGDELATSEAGIASPPIVTGPQSTLDSIDPPLNGKLFWAEAQEHYVRLTTDAEARMVLHRFSDILRALPEQSGVQVHRSHWVAYEAIDEAFMDGTNLRLRLKTGPIVPVSRSFRAQTERALKRVSIEPVRDK
ncbi:MAG: LytTR family DNA-binding domain-containing protein [Burkholderiaceae bacterium]